LKGVSPLLEHFLGDVLNPSAAFGVFGGLENELPIGQGNVHYVPDAEPERFEDRGGQDHGGRIPVRNKGQLWHGYLLIPILPG
jgi:hypothetical protein